MPPFAVVVVVMLFYSFSPSTGRTQRHFISQFVFAFLRFQDIVIDTPVVLKKDKAGALGTPIFSLLVPGAACLNGPVTTPDLK